jgi:general stress protein 26
MAFEQAEPELAAGGKRLLVNDDGDGVAFLATTNRLGHPQVAPVCPIFAQGNLYLCAAAHTPKHANLQARPHYVLHAFLGPRDSEFSIAGRAELVREPAEVQAVHAAIRFNFRKTDPIYQLGVERCFWGYWENPGQPNTRAVRRKWNAARRP